MRANRKATLAADVPYLTVEVPIELPSLNRLMSVHWRVAHKLKKQQEEAVKFLLDAEEDFDTLIGALDTGLVKLEVSLHRVGKRRLDGDNLQGAFKKIRDVVSRCLGIPNDDDARLIWDYSQSTDATPRVRIGFKRVA